MIELIDKARRFLASRQYAYRQVFKGPHAQLVLTDLAVFCRADESTFHDDARVHAVQEGRRQVWLRIQNHLGLTPEQLWAICDGRSEG